MTWMQDITALKNYYHRSLKLFSCCDLCSANIAESSLFGITLSQTLLCQNCLDDLPLFHQQMVSGNLLNWPAINKALPKISFDHLFSLSPYCYPYNHWLGQLKYQGRFELINLFSDLLCAQWHHSINGAGYPSVDLVISVPLHLKKWQVRGYNQAHLMAKRFSRQLSLPYDESLVVRVKHNDSQMGKTGGERRKNLANAFCINKKIPKNIKHVVLIDDVVTTGTTASEISKVLKNAGVETITLVTVCLSLPNSHCSS